MKTEGFQKTGGFELCSEATLLVSMPDFIDKNYTKQKAQEISTLIIWSFKNVTFNMNSFLQNYLTLEVQLVHWKRWKIWGTNQKPSKTGAFQSL